MKTNTEVTLAGGVALGAAVSQLIPKDWPLWQEVAVLAVICALVYVAAKIAFRSTNSETASK